MYQGCSGYQQQLQHDSRPPALLLQAPAASRDRSLTLAVYGNTAAAARPSPPLLLTAQPDREANAEVVAVAPLPAAAGAKTAAVAEATAAEPPVRRCHQLTRLPLLPVLAIAGPIEAAVPLADVTAGAMVMELATAPEADEAAPEVDEVPHSSTFSALRSPWTMPAACR